MSLSTTSKTTIKSVKVVRGNSYWLASVTEMPDGVTSLMILGFREGKEIFREIIDNIVVITRILQNPTGLSEKINEKLGLI